ncbi:MAG: hypothetical protein N2Z85_01900 [Patescibacteria group bacterium]|nr:hypothetical protein [Patescibacteria group bacterium]
MFRKFDIFLIDLFHRIWRPLSRISLFIVFFYFGLLKVLNLSPATPLVELLAQKTINFINFNYFLVFFGIFEMIIGLFFILPNFERIAIFLLFLHMITTFLPLVFLYDITWSGFLIPTLEGQYIIKNLVIISLALVIGGHLNKNN